jgi:uncharacterized protein (DUF362 family)
MHFNHVIVRKGADGYSLAREALFALALDRSEIGGKRILIKPNAGRLVGPCTGINTHPDVVAAVIDHFRENGLTDIVIAESPILGVKALASLEMCGIGDIARKRGVPLIDLDALPPVTVSIPDGKVIKKIRVCKEILENNYIISVPVMKTHMHTQVSLGLKNMKGCLYGREKVLLHQLPPSGNVIPPAKPLDMAVADMAGILMPDLTVIDGMIAQEGLGPSAGEAREMGIVIASRNCLAADTTAVRLMGFDPDNVHHLRETLTQRRQIDALYDFLANPITVDPAGYLDWDADFAPPPSKVSLEYNNVIVDDKDSCSACLSTVLMFLKRYYAEFADYLNEEKPLRIAIGKAIEAQSCDTLLIGNCTAKQKGIGVFIQGCPPVASQIFAELEKLYPMMKK